jgi:hypothetical protein
MAVAVTGSKNTDLSVEDGILWLPCDTARQQFTCENTSMA